tara:strand:- start:321 stop:1622 length:1302 start_codon:yes stop_codon:yes gene_type:complete
MFTYTGYNDNAPLINVVDAMMGQGKSTWLINTVNNFMSSMFDDLPTPRIIIVTPYLNEITRFKEACPMADFMEPKAYGHSKADDLHELLKGGCNIVTTHALWKKVNRVTYGLVSKYKYKLFIDEVMECVEQSSEISDSDFKMLFSHNLISTADDGRIIWNEYNEQPYKGKFDLAKSLCENGNLYRFKDKYTFWIFPPDFLAQFSEVCILTYLWKGSIMDGYVKASGYKVHHHTLVDYQLEPHVLINENYLRAIVSEKITIISDSKLNAIGDVPKLGRKTCPLSATWYKRQEDNVLKDIHNLIYNYYKNRVSGPAKFSMWTCYSAQRPKLKGAGYSKGFVSCNARATNEHRHRTNLAYMIDLYMVPIVKTFVESRGLKVDQDQYALSALVQWIFRSAIRDGQPITLYIPSERMRGLLMDWLNPKPMDLKMYKAA